MSPRHLLRGGLLLLGHRADCGGGQLASGLLRDRGACHFCVCHWAARDLHRLLRCALSGLAVWGLWGGLSPRSLRRPSVGRSLPVACPWRVVPPTVGWPLTLGGRRQTSWMLRPPPGRGPREALPAAPARLA